MNAITWTDQTNYRNAPAGEASESTDEQSNAGIEIGTRVSGVIAGQPFTGVVCTIGRRGGRSSIDADGKFTVIEAGELESVVVRTDNELATPSGRKVKLAHLTGAEALSSLRVL